MSVEFTIPELGENVDKGDVVRVRATNAAGNALLGISANPDFS